MNYPQRLLGLFIGIDSYQYVTDLGGCVKDINKVKDYFLSHLPPGMTSQIKTLFNEEATKAVMVRNFEEFLINQATADDVVLIYYSGHGAQEEADRVWRKVEADMGLEGLVCHDTGFKEGQASLLADKEIRYLLSRLSQKGCDIITIFDSCHSGDATRSTSNSSSGSLVPRRLTGALPKREWKDFIFSNEISPEDIEKRGWNQLMPEGRHIQLAACEDRELAYENAHGGVFSHNLLKVLRESEGHVSYFDLQSKIKYAIKGAEGSITQTPQAHAAYGYEKEIFKNFLSRNAGASPSFGNISYNAAREKWIFDRGEIHGIKLAGSEDEELLAVPVEGERMMYARIEETAPAFSIIEFLDPSLVQTDLNYSGFVKGMLRSQLKMAVVGDELTRAAVEEFYARKKDSFRGMQMELLQEEGLADYVIRGIEIKQANGSKDHFLILTYPHDERPLCEQVKGQISETAIETIFSHLEKLSKWNFVKQLKNEKEHVIPEDALSFEVQAGGQSLGINEAVIELETTPSAEAETYSGKKLPLGPEIVVSIKNTSSDPLYLACIYMGVFEISLNQGGVRVPLEFSLKPGIMQPQVQFLEPGKLAYLNGGKPLSFAMNAHIWQFNWPYQKVRFKLIASRSSFDAQLFEQDGIPAPVFPWPERSTGKGLKFTKSKGLSSKDWQAWTYELAYKNPYHDPS